MGSHKTRGFMVFRGQDTHKSFRNQEWNFEIEGFLYLIIPCARYWKKSKYMYVSKFLFNVI